MTTSLARAIIFETNYFSCSFLLLLLRVFEVFCHFLKDTNRHVEVSKLALEEANQNSGRE